MKESRIIKAREPFSVRRKEFWDIKFAHYLLSDRFAKKLSHEPDGLIFQPSLEPYTCGPCKDCLKWKPGRLNSVDFRLKIVWEEGQGVLRQRVCQLFVGGKDQPFTTMKYTKSLKDLNNKIVECKIDNNAWVFMRERTDKSFPNGYNTAVAVVKSIVNPVTEDSLVRLIQQVLNRDSDRNQDSDRFRDLDRNQDSVCMPPPRKIPRK